MPATRTDPELSEKVRNFVRSGFLPHFEELRQTFPSRAIWRRLRELGSELWLDTGDMAEAERLWTQEFTALTTNNTLLNKEVQTGQYDELIASAGAMLAPYGLSERRRMLEIGFILNARHALRLVERFDAYVSVEEHTDLAGNVEAAVEYARRYHAICPERFFVKIPFTPAGLLATRRLAAEGITVNHTLGFSARQNYVIARIGRPRFVNVFLGRLNSFVADNGLGDGTYVGERATLASQAAVRLARRKHGAPSRQIAASFRAGGQVRDLAGTDVMTMPPKVAGEFLDLNIAPEALADRTGREYQPPLREGVDPKAVGLDTLWDIDEQLVGCLDALDRERLERFTPEDLVGFFAAHGCADVLVRWTNEQVATSRKEGKIPRLDNWREALAGGEIGLDALMNLAGLGSFAADQKAMDDRVKAVLIKNPRRP